MEYSRETFREAKEGVQLKQQHVVLNKYGFVSYDHLLPQGNATRGKRTRLRAHLREKNGPDFNFPECARRPGVVLLTTEPEPATIAQLDDPDSLEHQHTLEKMLANYQTILAQYEKAANPVIKKALKKSLEIQATALAKFQEQLEKKQ